MFMLYVRDIGPTVIIKEIKRLPVDKRLIIGEQALKSIREAENKKAIPNSCGSAPRRLYH
jgi:hypothetical protein